MKAVVGDWKLLFEARGTRKCCFRGRLVGGGEESAGLFELLTVVRCECMSVLISRAYDEIYFALQRI